MKVYIDGKEIDAEAGMTVLQVARKAGIRIPTLCHDENKKPLTSCFVCAVRIEGHPSLQPSCAARVHDGMRVFSSSPEVVEARRTALELLFSDHAGRCVAACAMACPAHLDIPAFLRELRVDQPGKALDIIHESLALPTVLGRVCRGYCESACVRKKVDDSLAIRSMHGRLAETLLPDRIAAMRAQGGIPAESGKSVAIVGAGPAGLAAAFYLQWAGVSCLLLDSNERPGGLLRHIPGLDQSLVDLEIEYIMAMGAKFQGGWTLGRDGGLKDLLKDHAAVVLATGASVGAPSSNRKVDLDFVKGLGLDVGAKIVEFDRQTMATNMAHVFAAGEVAGAANIVRSVAGGRAAAVSIAQHLSGKPVAGEPKPLYFVGSEPDRVNLETLDKSPRLGGEKGPADSEMKPEAERCLNCGCEKEHSCGLRGYGMEYDANPRRFKGDSRSMTVDDEHPEIIFESGKCILCGLCVETALEEGEEIGLCFTGRGFPTRVEAPLGAKMSDGLRRAALKCAALCPTAAISVKGEWK
jgi:ferredoxin